VQFRRHALAVATNVRPLTVPDQLDAGVLGQQESVEQA
jgi:hypothetical protein